MHVAYIDLIKLTCGFSSTCTCDSTCDFVRLGKIWILSTCGFLKWLHEFVHCRCFRYAFRAYLQQNNVHVDLLVQARLLSSASSELRQYDSFDCLLTSLRLLNKVLSKINTIRAYSCWSALPDSCPFLSGECDGTGQAHMVILA